MSKPSREFQAHFLESTALRDRYNRNMHAEAISPGDAVYFQCLDSMDAHVMA